MKLHPQSFSLILIFFLVSFNARPQTADDYPDAKKTVLLEKEDSNFSFVMIEYSGDGAKDLSKSRGSSKIKAGGNLYEVLSYLLQKTAIDLKIESSSNIKYQLIATSTFGDIDDYAIEIVEEIVSAMKLQKETIVETKHALCIKTLSEDIEESGSGKGKIVSYRGKVKFYNSTIDEILTYLQQSSNSLVENRLSRKESALELRYLQIDIRNLKRIKRDLQKAGINSDDCMIERKTIVIR